MNYFQKYRIAIWAIIILSVIVLSSVLTVLVYRLNEKPAKPRDNKQGQIIQFLKKELDLTPEQEKAVKEFRGQMHKNSKVIFDSLEAKRILLLKEMEKSQPDTAILFKITDEMGMLHGKLRRESLKNLLNLRNICTSEQIVRLNKLNSKFFRPEGPRRKPENKSDDKKDSIKNSKDKKERAW